MSRRLRGQLLFLALYVPALAFFVTAGAPEVTRDFGRVAKDFRVVALSDGKPVGTTLSRIGRPDPKVTFLLTADVVELPLGDLHRATVLQKHADWQLVEYEFANGSSTVSRYRAYRDRVEPVSHRVTFDPGLIVLAILLAVPAWLLAALGNWLWTRYGDEKPEVAGPPPGIYSRLKLGWQAYAFGSIFLAALGTLAYAEPFFRIVYALFVVLAVLGALMRWAVARLGAEPAARGIAVFCLAAPAIAWLLGYGPLAVVGGLLPVAAAAVGLPRDWPLKWVAVVLGLCAAGGTLAFFVTSA